MAAKKKQVKKAQRNVTGKRVARAVKTAETQEAKKDIAAELVASIDNISTEVDNGTAKVMAVLSEQLGWLKRISDTLERIEQTIGRSGEALSEAVEKEITLMERTFSEGVQQGRASVAHPAVTVTGEAAPPFEGRVPTETELATIMVPMVPAVAPAVPETLPVPPTETAAAPTQSNLSPF
jgi:hypothetical protein